MKCISLWQPWASWMAWGVKTIETRSWPTKHRGPLLIHAAKTQEEMSTIYFNEDREILERIGKTSQDFVFGAIIAVVDLVDCQSTELLKHNICEVEALLGNYESGRFGWVTRNVREFIQPIPYRGMQGLFDVPDEVVREAIEGLA